jgi:alpha-galactosidase
MAQVTPRPDAENIYHTLLEHPAQFPASFTYDGKQYHGFPAPDFAVIDRTHTEKADHECNVLILQGPRGLTVVIDTAFYPAFGVYEWTLHFVNHSDADTGVLENLYACDVDFPGATPLLRGILGDHEHQYRPYVRDLSLEDVHFVSDSGRPTHVYFPYFNVEHSDGGTLLAIGWAGTWTASFTTEKTGRIRYRARSVNNLCLALQPGESIRTALIVLAPYQGRNDAEATNHWRRWFIACNLPKWDKSGQDMRPFSTVFFALDTGRPNSDGSISEAHDTWRPTMDKLTQENLHMDFRWFDAGWYPDPYGRTVPVDWWGTVGVWELDPVKWPGDTFRQSVKEGHRRNMKTLMWFEPERVTHPEALAANYGYNEAWAILREGGQAITNDLGNPDCFEWTAQRIIKVLTDNDVDMYREDNNANPGPLWRERDALSGRPGLTECRFVEAHYRLWDRIIEATAENGGCAFCDSCASGGGRNDLESLRRGVPLLRSDADRTSTALRLSMTTAFNRYIPVCGANTREKVGQLDATGIMDMYTWRASYLPILNVDSQYVYSPNQNFDMLRHGLAEWDSLKHLLLKDFYVLTPWHAPNDKQGFTAYAFYDPDAREGVLLAFRMEDCACDTLSLTLPFAGKDEAFLLTNADDGSSIQTTGSFTLTLPHPRCAQLYRIRAGASM